MILHNIYRGDLFMLNKIILLLREKKRTQKDLCAYLGLNPWTFSEWKAGKSESYKKYLPQIAEFFGCSVDYLLGKEQKKEAVQTDSQSREEKIDELMSLYAKLSSERKEKALLAVYREYVAQQEENQGGNH